MNGWEEEVEWPPHHPQATSTRISDVWNIGMFKISIVVSIVASHSTEHSNDQTSDENSDAIHIYKTDAYVSFEMLTRR